MPWVATDLRQRLASGPTILDGATGTELQRRGVPTTLPLWSARALLSHPEVVVAIHRDYVAAGADLIVANTFRTNPRVLAAAGLEPRGGELNGRAVALAREGVRAGLDVSDDGGPRRNVLVAASVAPVEDCYCPERVPDKATLAREHRQMANWLATTDADLVWIETMNTVREARAAAGAVAERHLPFAVSFVTRSDGALLSGEPLAEAVAAVEPFQPLAVGLNCVPPTGLTENLRRLRDLTSRPLAAYGHIGNPDPISGWAFSESTTPTDYAQHAEEWCEIGATVVGGCCGTTPAHIAEVSRRLRGCSRQTRG